MASFCPTRRDSQQVCWGASCLINKSQTCCRTAQPALQKPLLLVWGPLCGAVLQGLEGTEDTAVLVLWLFHAIFPSVSVLEVFVHVLLSSNGSCTGGALFVCVSARAACSCSESPTQVTLLCRIVVGGQALQLLSWCHESRSAWSPRKLPVSSSCCGFAGACHPWLSSLSAKTASCLEGR